MELLPLDIRFDGLILPRREFHASNSFENLNTFCIFEKCHTSIFRICNKKQILTLNLNNTAFYPVYMHSNEIHNKTLMNHAVLAVFLTLFLSNFIYMQPGFGCKSTAAEITGKTLPPGNQVNLTTQKLYGPEKFSPRVFRHIPIPVIKSKTSQPLSRQNYKKTRPRGIPAQQPGSKDLTSAGLLIMFPPAMSVAICTTKRQALNTASGCAERIRPPPCIRES